MDFAALGEASHGTAEFYRLRAAISRRLIEEKGFEAVLVEADWPDALRLDRYVRGGGEDALDGATAVEPLEPGPGWQREAIPDTYPFGV
ncbi:erythromycin esterase family protein [Halomonas ventosae]|uniref:Erythromycin esterase n=1 Tax=Halomonas ventosae TaxID=229007 RepID=A0A2T0VM72_9GAMM|nr:erythromycin esterase family protein [Halomonas ventosae]PRY71299.1 erythromycin esterase [Halomonas ventosae]